MAIAKLATSPLTCIASVISKILLKAQLQLATTAMAPTNFFRQTRGQATLEAAVSLPVILLSLFLIMAGLYGIFLQNVFHHQTYEYLLCAEFSDAPACEANLKNKMATVVPFGRWQVKVLPTTNETRKVEIDFSLRLYGKQLWTWNYQNQIKRDLSSSSF